MNTETINTELKKYDVNDAKIASLKKECLVLKVDGLEDQEGYEKCRVALRNVITLRTGIEKTRKILKADSLEFGRAVDAKAKELTKGLLEIESHLSTQKNIVDDEKRRIQQEKIDAQKREEERLKREEEERLEKIRLEQEAKLKAEEERLNKIREEQERKERELREEQEFREKQKRKEQEKIEAEKRKIEQEKRRIQQEKEDFEREQIRIEKERLQKIEDEKRLIQQEKINEENRLKEIEQAKIDERKRIEREQREKEECERIAKIEAEKEAKRIEELKPDFTRIKEIAKSLEAIEMPKCKTEKGKDYILYISQQILKIVVYINNIKI